MGWQRDAYTYTRMISLLGKMRDWKGALRILAEARDHGLKPTTYMYNAAMQACALSNRSENIPMCEPDPGCWEAVHAVRYCSGLHTRRAGFDA